MRVLYFFLNLPTMMYQWQQYHIVNEMSEHNCQIDVISPLSFGSIEEANECIIKRLKEGEYDLFFTCLTSKFLFPETLERIKQLGLPSLLFCPDNLVAPYNHKSIAPLFDMVWLTSKETEYLFKRWNCRTLFLPYAANPGFLKPVICDNEIEKVGFIGTPHGSRIDCLNTLLRAKIPVTLHSDIANVDESFMKASIQDYARTLIAFLRYPIGRKLAIAAIIDKCTKRQLVDLYGCLELKTPIPLDHLAEYNGKYALVLSFTDANSTGVLKEPVKIVNLRNFEIPMSGGLQCTTYSEELASYFENDKEIVMGKTSDELIDKIKFYLREDKVEIRKAMRIAARSRAEKEHTWYCRFSKIFKEMNLKV